MLLILLDFHTKIKNYISWCEKKMHFFCCCAWIYSILFHRVDRSSNLVAITVSLSDGINTASGCIVSSCQWFDQRSWVLICEMDIFRAYFRSLLHNSNNEKSPPTIPDYFVLEQMYVMLWKKKYIFVVVYEFIVFDFFK